jgi:hypothetical protein
MGSISALKRSEEGAVQGDRRTVITALAGRGSRS